MALGETAVEIESWGERQTDSANGARRWVLQRLQWEGSSVCPGHTGNMAMSDSAKGFPRLLLATSLDKAQSEYRIPTLAMCPGSLGPRGSSSQPPTVRGSQGATSS
jgi:hypothetical protein